MKKITESNSNHEDLDKKSTEELLQGINSEDKKVALAVEKEINHIKAFINAAYAKMKEGGRLFYIGAGTSGRLGVVDASECPPTFGTEPNKVIGLIAGGDMALRNSIEDAEDDFNKGWDELKKHNINSRDFIIGIAASGTTPYDVGALKNCIENNIPTACICSNPNSPLTKYSDYPIEVVVGPEYITGSSRMKSGTAQKLILNIISTTTMIKLGHIKDNKMIDIQITNEKLTDRGVRIISNSLSIEYSKASDLLNKYKSVRKAIESYRYG